MSSQVHPEKLGRYEIVRELGKGAMGVVYEGRDPNIGRRVAIKTARRDVMAASGMANEMMERFLREARAAGALNHPNIITIFDADEQDEIAYIAMEYVEGGNLADRIRDRGSMSFEEVVATGATIAEALAAAHDRGIVHRDIKPANILTPIDAPIIVADFGIARVSDSNLTQEGAMIGTPHYMSPEQFSGQRADGRSDLFSLGIILYELTTGEKPFTGEALSTVMHHVMRTEPVPPAELNFSIPHPLNDVIMQALNKRPDRRYPDGRAMAAALRESLKPKPDPNILFGIVEPEEATVNLKPSGDATVLSATGALPEAESTSARPGADAGTLAKKSARPADETAFDPPRAFPTPVHLAGGGVALVMVLLGATLFLRGGATDPVPPAPVNAPAAMDGSDAGPSAWFSSMIMDVYQAKSPEIYEQWQGAPEAARDINAIIDDVVEVSQSTVAIYDVDTGELLAERTGFSTGRIVWEGKPSRVRYEVRADGADASLMLTRMPESAEASLGNVIVVLPPRAVQ